MWVTSKPLQTKDAWKALGRAVKNLDDYIEKGQIEILDYRDWYTRAGGFKADRVLRGWVKKEKQALKKGFKGLRLTGNTLWLERKDWRSFSEYENTVNSIIGKHRMIVVCSYSLERCRPSDVVDVVDSHQFAIIRKEKKWHLIGGTEYKPTLEALKESERRYRTLFEESRDAIGITTPEGGFIYVNQTYANLFGHTKEELLKLNVKETYTRPEDREKLQQEIERKGHIQEYETKRRRRDGTIIDCLVTSTPLYREDGIILGYQSIIRDITVRKRMEEAIKKYAEHLEDLVEERTRELKKSEMKHRLLVENMSDFVFTVDLKGNFTFASSLAEEMTGYKVSQLLSMNMKELIAPEHYPGIQKELQMCIAGEKNLPPHEFEIIKADRKRLPIETGATTILSEEGKLVGIQGIARDLTERKKLEERLQNAERLAAIGETAAMVGHDVRNPLQGITGAAYLLKTRLASSADKKVNEMLEVIDQCVTNADKIVNDLLDYSREVWLERTDNSLQQLVTDALDNVKVPENIQVIGLAESSLRVTVDPEKIRRVFINLLRNAVDAMPDGGKLTITSKESNGKVKIAITDTGIGMTEEMMGKLWSPLYTTKPRGMGFGLVICKRIVEAHEGTITAESKVGEGSTFTVTLPHQQNVEVT